jgi:hypothetical protein
VKGSFEFRNTELELSQEKWLTTLP